jgi:hypothetical protein
MKIYRFSLVAILLLGILALAFTPRPDVKTTSTTKLTFKGALGTMMKLAGGNKPVTTTQYIHGNQSRSDHLDEEGKITTSSIVDLDRELIINIDHKKKEYTEMTFAEFREMIRKGFGGMSDRPKEEGKAKKEQPEVKWSFDAKVDRTGEKKNVAGYNTEKVVLTLTAQAEAQAESGKPGEMQKGGMVVTSTNWMANDVKGYDEVRAFQMAYAEKLGMTPGSGNFAAMLGNMMKSNPQLAEAMKKLEQEGRKLQGVPLVTESVFETWGQPAGEAPEAAAAEPEQQEMPKSVGGMLGGLGKKLGKKAVKKEENAGNSGRNVLMQSFTETTEISNSPVDAGLFVPPASYEKKASKN